MKLIYRQHAVRRMFERGISSVDIRLALETGRVIEDYPNDQPYPSCLWLGQAGHRVLHIVYADNLLDQERIVITAYEPNPALWHTDFSIRKK